MTQQLNVFLVDPKYPTSKIREVPAEIISRKFTWAEYKGKRHLIGTSAFYTLPAAKRAKVGYLMKLLEGSSRIYIKRFYPDFYADIKKQINSGNIS